MIYKALYDLVAARRQAFGRVLYVTAPTGATARNMAEAEALRLDPDCQVSRLDLTLATVEQLERWEGQRAKLAQWQSNVTSGQPNRRGDL